MKQIVIEGGHPLKGTITVSGAKNSAVALVPASLLCDEDVMIDNVPDISDIDALEEMLEYLGAKVKRMNSTIEIDATEIQNREIPEKISKKLRASYYFMGALLGKYKVATMYFPGGCPIGARPIDLHLKGFEALGAHIIEDGNKYTIKAEELKGSNIYLDMPSVGATINIMLAAVKATGTTTIENAACEPEIVNVATFLNNMGAKIKGAGTSTIIIKGVEHLHHAYTEVIPDRIEAGTYLIAGALLGDNLKIENVIPEHILSLLQKLKQMGVKMKLEGDTITIRNSDCLKPVHITTGVFPGFPTDLQQPLTTLLTCCNGKSTITETIYENRFLNTKYLNQMGANIHLKNPDCIEITGPTSLSGTTVVATDLRAGACLILAGLIASGTTTIQKVEHVLRGYENIIEKLSNVGAKIRLEEIK